MNQDQDQPQTPWPPGDFERDPLKLAERLAEEYPRLEEEYESLGGTRDQTNRHLQESYRLGFFYHQNPAQYLVFRALPYFFGIRQKPHEKSIMRSVLKFTMRAKGNKHRLGRIYKRAPVLEYLRTLDVLPEDVTAFLGMNGGVDCIYDQLNAAKALRRKKCNAGDNREADAASRQMTSDSDAAPVTEAEADDDNPAPIDPDQRDPSPGAATEPVESLDDEIDPLALPRRRRVNVRDLRTELVIEMEPHQIEFVLNSAGGSLEFRVLPAHEQDFRRVVGHITNLRNRDDQSSSRAA